MTEAPRRRPFPERRLAVVPNAVREFLATEAAGGIVLGAAVLIALVWVNAGGAASYERLWTSTRPMLSFVRPDFDLRHGVNEGLMAIFFFVIGLEVKRELVVGELREWRRASLPVFGALGGMVVPALVFLACNVGGRGARGWGIPMATDIAFALGVLVVMGRRVPRGLKLFLLTLAVVDDIGAIVVIAIFYPSRFDPVPLAVAVGLVVLVIALRRAGVANVAVFAVVGVGLWFAVLQSGVHATIAGVVLGLLAPVSMAERLQHRLHPVSSFIVVPLFALANAGVVFEGEALLTTDGMRVAVGVGAGLVIGKFVGVLGGARLAVRLDLASLPSAVTWGHVAGAAALAGIGFTVSLFVTELAFADPDLRAAAKIGILAASVVASGLGAALLLRRSAPRYD